MDEKEFLIFSTYLKYIGDQQELVMNAASLAGLAQTNDLKMRGTIKEIGRKFQLRKEKMAMDMQAILDPENAPDVEGVKEEVEKNSQKKPKN